MSGDENARFKRAGELAESFKVHNAARSRPRPPARRCSPTRSRSRPASDLQSSELLTAPFTAIALVIVFGSIVAALLPLSVGVFAVVGTLLVLLVLTLFTDISVFALNLTTAMGLGLGIDYSLFIVSRYREELAKGASTNVAVGRSMQTAGRTVLFSAGTVMVSLSALAVFDVPTSVRSRFTTRHRVGPTTIAIPTPRPRPTPQLTPPQPGRPAFFFFFFH